MFVVHHKLIVTMNLFQRQLIIFFYQCNEMLKQVKQDVQIKYMT